MTDDRTDGTEGGEADVEERVLGFLRTADRPRVLASDVAAGLDLPRGRVRTRLQSFADEGRVVRTDAEGTARWAASERAGEPDHGPEPGPAPDTEVPNGDPEAAESPSERGDEGNEPNADGATNAGGATDAEYVTDAGGATNAEDATDAPAANAGEPTDADDSDAARTARTERTDRSDAPTTAAGPSGGRSDRPATETAPEPAIDRPAGGGRGRRPGPMVALALIAGLILALAALRRLRRR